MTRTALTLALLAGTVTLAAVPAQARTHYRPYYFDQAYNSYDEYVPAQPSYGPPSDALGPGAANGINVPGQTQGTATGPAGAGGSRSGATRGSSRR
jgi:hypothetical protein